MAFLSEKIKIYYWDTNKEIFIDFIEHGKYYPWSISIKNGMVEIDIEGEYYGPVNYTIDLTMYDLCALMALWHECYGQ